MDLTGQLSNDASKALLQSLTVLPRWKAADTCQAWARSPTPRLRCVRC